MSDRITIEIDDASLTDMINKLTTTLAPTGSGGGAKLPRGKGATAFPRSLRRQYAILGYSELFGIDLTYPIAKQRWNPVVGVPRNFAAFWKLNEELKKPGVLDALKNLPTLDRNLRVIVNQFPGGRIMSQGLFRARWIGKMMDDYPVETAFIIAATGIMAYKAVSGLISGVKQQRGEYKMMLTELQPTVTKDYLDKWVSEREDWWRRWIVG